MVQIFASQVAFMMLCFSLCLVAVSAFPQQRPHQSCIRQQHRSGDGAGAFIPMPTVIGASRTGSQEDPNVASTTSPRERHWMDTLKFNGATPSFDVLARTKQYTSEPGYVRFLLSDIPEEYYDLENYVFRGPIVGPINRADLVRTNALSNLQQAFPDLERRPFGFTVDPENPFRVLFFERWVATHTGDLDFAGLLKAPPTGRRSVSPVFPFGIVWTPEGKIIYETLTTAVDRFEGNTRGKVAVFGLLETAGISLDNTVGNPFLALAQRINRILQAPAQVYSRDEDIPRWWKSTSRGAEPNDDVPAM